MAKTKLTIPIDSSTLVEAVCHTKFTEAEQKQMLDHLIPVFAYNLEKKSFVLKAKAKIAEAWFSTVLVPTLKAIEKGESKTSIDKLIKQGEKALDIL